jgi:ubiquitin C-terminal hydrolase
MNKELEDVNPKISEIFNEEYENLKKIKEYEIYRKNFFEVESNEIETSPLMITSSSNHDRPLPPLPNVAAGSHGKYNYYSMNPSPPKSSTGFVGLKNQGATCYLNSLIQSLYMTPIFRKAIFSWRYDKENDKSEGNCIPLQLQR